jgi:uncharacterized surface protein with fasciclin (FAS1) repeats
MLDYLRGRLLAPLAAVLLVAGCAETMEEPAPAPLDIVDTAASAGNFKTLVSLIQEAGLVETLKGPGPFTVFAPTDEAFANLPKGTFYYLTRPEHHDELVALLTYHVVPANVTYADIAGQKTAIATMNGAEVFVDGTNGFMVNDATVVQPDIPASNGVIHAIDKVLTPPVSHGMM